MPADLFSPADPADKHPRASNQRGGTYSILTGIAAKHSFKTAGEVKIAALVANLSLPDYPPMPSHDGPVAMPPRAPKRRGRKR